MGDSYAVKKVLLRAPVLSQSGYGVHSRQIARWLLSRKDVDLTVVPVQWGITPWNIDANDKGGLIGEMISRAKVDPGPFDVSIQVQLPNEWDPRLAKFNVGVTAGVETTICNPEWVKCVNAMGHVIVPSSFVKSTFERTGTLLDDGKHVTVIPESFIDEVLDETLEPISLEIGTEFNFLVVGQMTGRHQENDRKNLFSLMKWFCETFKDDERVGLVLKTNNGRETKLDRLITTDVVRQALSSVRKGQFPKVHLLHGAMSDREIASLYRHPSIKAFVTLTRGEGFGLPILEAAASGLPIIATNWSGYLDFMKLGRFIKLDFELKQIPKSRIDNNIFVAEAKWADVNEADVKRKLSKFKERPEPPTEWARDLQNVIRREYSFDAVKNQYDALWEKIVA